LLLIGFDRVDKLGHGWSARSQRHHVAYKFTISRPHMRRFQPYFRYVVYMTPIYAYVDRDDGLERQDACERQTMLPTA
jgi:hypothetical protein